MKRRRWLAMAMAVVMTASSIPAGTFTAFAEEEFADVIEEESALLTDDNMDLTVDEAADPFLEDIGEDALPELLSAGDEAETEEPGDLLLEVSDEPVIEDLMEEFDEEGIETGLEDTGETPAPVFEEEDLSDETLPDGFLTDEEELPDDADALPEVFFDTDTLPEGAAEDEEAETLIFSEEEIDEGEALEDLFLEEIPETEGFEDYGYYTAEAELSVGMDQSVSFEEYEYEKIYSFIPEEAGIYSFTGTGFTMPVSIELYDWNSYWMAESQPIDEGDPKQRMTCTLKAERLYYVFIKNWDETEQSGTLRVEKADLHFPKTSYYYLAEPGEVFTLNCEVTSDADLTFCWMDTYTMLPIEENTGSSSVTLTADKNYNIYCEVSNGEEFIQIYYRIEVNNHLYVEIPDNWVYLSPGETLDVTFQAIVSAEDTSRVTYSWREANGENSEILSTTDTLTLPSANRSASYILIVEDGYGNSCEADAHIVVDNSFRAGPKNGTTNYLASVGDEIVLEVDAFSEQGDLHYSWSWWSGYEYVSLGEDASSLTVIAGQVPDGYAEEGTVFPTYDYYCSVTDDYGNGTTIDFHIFMDGDEWGYHSLTLDSNGGYFVSDTGERYYQKTVGIGESDSSFGWSYIPETDEEKVFAGWSRTEDGTDPLTPDYDFTYSLSGLEENTVLYAVWEDAAFITWDANGGYFDEDPSVLTKRTHWEELYQINNYNYPEAEGKEFLGWNVDPDAAEPLQLYDWDTDTCYFEEIHSVRLYAVWADTVKITWELGDGGYFDKETIYDEESGTTYEAEVTRYVRTYRVGEYVGWMPYCEHEDKYFLGWRLENASEPLEWQSDEDYETYLFRAEEDTTLYAVWDDAVRIDLHGNGGTFLEWDYELEEYVDTETSFSKVRKGEKIGGFGQPEAPDGKTFLGWSPDPDAAEPMPYIEEEDGSSYILIAEENMDLYAVWETYPVIIWDANGGYFDGDPEKTQICQSWISFDDLSSQWYSGPDNDDESQVFAGWTDIEGGTDPIEDYHDYFSERSDITLYAIWEEGIPVTWDANGGYFGEADDPHETMITYVRAGTNSFWRPDEFVTAGEEGMMLQKWSTTADGLGESYPIVEEPLTMYAVWAEKCTITLDAGDGFFIHWLYDEEIGGEYSVREKTMTFERAAGTKLWQQDLDEALGDYGLEAPEDKELIGWEPTDREWIDDGDMYCLIEADMTFTARWGSYYTITWDANGGYFLDWNGEEYVRTDMVEQQMLETRNITAWDDPQHENQFYFKGWGNQADSTEPVSFSYYDEDLDRTVYNYQVTGDQTFYAIWEEPETIAVGEIKQVSRKARFLFTAPEDDVYVFSSFDNEGDPMGWLYDTEGSLLEENDDSDERNFSIAAELEAGEVVLLEAGFFSDGTGNYLLKVEHGVPVTFDANGGYFLDSDENEVTSIVRYVAPGKYPKGPQPETDDASKMFERWSTSPDGTGEGLSEAAAPVTYYAIWNTAYTITLDAGEGYFEYWDDEDEVIREKTITFRMSEGDRLWEEEIDNFIGDYSLEEPVGKGFLGWNLTSAEWEENDWDERYFLVESDVTITATWGEYHTITWDANGGYFDGNPETTQRETQWVKLSDVGNYWYSVPQNPAESSVFIGWTDAEGGTEPIEDYSSYFTTVEDITLYAVWSEGIPVTFDANGGYFLDSDGNEVTSIVTYAALGYYPDEPYPETHDTSKRFDSWSTSPDGTGDDISEVTEPVTYYAIWENVFTITLDAGEGYFEYWDGDDEDDLIREKTITIRRSEGSWFWEEDFEDYLDEYELYGPEGKGFLGWELSGAEWEEDEDYGDWYFRVESNVTITATWGEYHTITWDANGGYFDGDPEATQRETQWLKPSDAGNDWDYVPQNPVESIVCIGWTDVEGGTQPIEDYSSYFTAVEDITLYAVWSEGIPVTWNANGGYFQDGDDEVTSIITYTAPGAYPDQPEPYIGDESKMFDRWSTSPDGTGDDISEVTGPVTYYAIWINAYTITLDAGEGYFGIWDWDDEEEDEVYIQKKTFTFKKAEGYRLWEYEIDDLWDGWEISGPEGKGFAGWKMTGTDWEEDDYYGERYFLVESDVTITAQWGNYHTITWDANGGYFPDEDDETMERRYVEGKVLDSLPEPENADTHKIFVGWTTVQGSTDVLTYDEDIDGYLEITEDMTLYAVWEDGYVVTFHGNGGEYGSEDWDDEEDDWVITYSPTKVCMYRKDDVVQSYDGEFETWDYDRIPDKKYLKGWSLTEGGPILEYDEELGGLIRVDRDLDLYAVWEDDYEIVIDPNGGYWWDSEADHKYYDVRTWKSSYTSEEGQISFLELRAGLYNDEQRMAVVGFSTDPEGENIVIRADGELTLPVTSDMMLYAVWEPGVIISLSQAGYIDEDRTILVNAMQWHWKWDGEHVSQTVPQNIPISRVAMPLVYKIDESDWDGFAGWSLSPYKKDIIRGDGADGSYVLTEDVMLYPILRNDAQEPETYVLVVWDANGGTFAQDGYPSKADQQVGVGTALGEAGIPQLNERSGYELAGWSTNADAQEPDYTSSEIAAYTVTEAVTFYAVWKVKEPEGNTTAQELADDVNDIIGQAAAASTDEEKAAVERAIEDLVETLDNNDNQAIIDSATEEDPQLAAMNSQMDQLLQGQGYGDVEIGSTIAAEAPISPGSSENIVVSMSGAAATVASQIRKDLENDEIDPEALGEDETITYHAQVVVSNVTQSAASLDLAMDISVSVVADIPGEEPKVEEHVSLTAPVTVSMILPESYQGKEFDLMHETNEGVAQIPYDSNNVAGGLAVSFAVPGCSMFRVVNVRCTNHSFDEIGELYQEATCTSNEVRKYHCQNAGCSEYQLNEIPGTMKAHEYETTGTVIKDPTCTEEGTIVYNCRNCTHTKEETIAKIAHTEEVIPAVEPTCTKAGQTAGKKCSVCGTILIAPTSRPATGVHSWSAWTVTKAATCSASGTQTHTCSVCKTTETQTIAATGKHTPVAIAAVPATCTAAGKTAGSKCSVCGTVITAQQTVPATGHKPVAIAAVPATCIAAGKTAGSKCSVCGDVITAQQTVPALGHKWDAGKVTTEPTASAAGVKTYTCTVCNATKTEPIPKLTPAEAQKKAEGDPNDPKSVAGAEKAMTAVKDNGEPKGSSFSTIQLYSSKQTKNSITLKWNKVKGASGYVIYGNMCGGKYKLERIAKQKKNSFVYKNLKKGTYYKFTVAAYKSVDGKEEVIGSSKTVHVATTGGKVTNVKSVAATVKKKTVKKLSLKAKKSAVVAAKETLQNKKLTLKRHRKIKYESSDTKIATVNAKGKVTAKKKGKCFIYVYSQSGAFAKITLTVK